MKEQILISAMLLVAPVAMADTFTPIPVANASQVQAINAEESVGNGNIQNAITQLENAQVDIRNELLNCKTKYADIDAQYKLVKAERTALNKQVKTIEKRIKEIDRAKEKIRKNML